MAAFWLILVVVAMPGAVDSEPEKTSIRPLYPEPRPSAGPPMTIETVIVGPFRLWHIIGFVSTAITIAVVLVCCCVDFRIPRTKQAIQESAKQRELNKNFVKQLNSGVTGPHDVQPFTTGFTPERRQRTLADSLEQSVYTEVDKSEDDMLNDETVIIKTKPWKMPVNESRTSNIGIKSKSLEKTSQLDHNQSETDNMSSRNGSRMASVDDTHFDDDLSRPGDSIPLGMTQIRNMQMRPGQMATAKSLASLATQKSRV